MERRMSLVVPPVEELVRSDHEYRLMLKILDWGKLARPLRALYSDLIVSGIGGTRGRGIEG
jgi:hypothetical protein